MDYRRSLGWVAMGLVVLAGTIMLAAILDQRDTHSRDERGRALVAEGRYVQAIRVLSRAVAETPGDSSAHHYLGLAYAGIGLCGAAWIHFEEATRLAPAFGRPYPELGPACRGVAVQPLGPGRFEHAVHRDRP